MKYGFYKNDEIERLEQENDRLRRTNNELRERLAALELLKSLTSLNPMEIASYIINLDWERETSDLERVFGRPENVSESVFSLDDLEAIAGHIMVHTKLMKGEHTK